MTELDEAAVLAALERLREHVLVWKTGGARAEKWEQNVDRRWSLDAAGKAVMTLLLLRGEQTPGELRGRSDRLHAFATPGEVEDALAALSRRAPSRSSPSARAGRARRNRAGRISRAARFRRRRRRAAPALARRARRRTTSRRASRRSNRPSPRSRAISLS